jgi:hypothetical protein
VLGENKKENLQCHEPIHRILHNTGAGGPSNWPAPGAASTRLAREFEPSASAIRYWLKQAGLDEGLRSDGLTTDERAELNHLRHENRAGYAKSARA